jgi:hypothetical protein
MPRPRRFPFIGTNRSSRSKYDEELRDISYARIKEFVLIQDHSIDSEYVRRMNFASKLDVCSYADRRGIDMLPLLQQIQAEVKAKEREETAKANGFACAAEMDAQAAAKDAAAAAVQLAAAEYLRKKREKEEEAARAAMKAELEKQWTTMKGAMGAAFASAAVALAPFLDSVAQASNAAIASTAAVVAGAPATCLQTVRQQGEACTASMVAGVTRLPSAAVACSSKCLQHSKAGKDPAAEEREATAMAMGYASAEDMAVKEAAKDEAASTVQQLAAAFLRNMAVKEAAKDEAASTVQQLAAEFLRNRMSDKAGVLP